MKQIVISRGKKIPPFFLHYGLDDLDAQVKRFIPKFSCEGNFQKIGGRGINQISIFFQF